VSVYAASALEQF